MEIDLDTFLVTVYCSVDDWYREQVAPQKPARPGHQPDLSDSEVLTLAVLAQWQEHTSERGLLTYVRKHWQSSFPRMLSQSAFNRRVRDLTFVLDALGPALAQRLGPRLLPGAVYEVLDGVPVPLMRRCRGERHRLFGDEAGVGRGGSDRDWYDGVRVLARVSNQGLLTGFVIGPAPTDERWLADALLRWSADPEAPAPSLEDLTPVLGASHDKGGGRRGPTGPLDGRWSAGPPSGLPSLGDLGYAGERWTIHWRDDSRTVVLTERCFEAIEDEQERKRWCDWLHGHRQVMETVNELLDHVLHLKLPGARTVPGLLARLGAKVAALNLLVGINHQVGRPSFAHYSPLQ